MIKNNPIYSVVVPVYNSELIINKTVTKIRQFFILEKLKYEIILVNDGSEDKSWDIISKLAKKYKEISAINLLKNYGQHNTNLCGFRASRGDYIITLDDDLQNPPNEIGKLINKIHEGYDLVFGKFKKKQHSHYRNIGSYIVNYLNRKIFKIEKNLTISNFRIIHRSVIDRTILDNGQNPYIPGILLENSNNRADVLVKHAPRTVGKTNYSLCKILTLVGSLLFNHSSIPLRLTAIIGAIISTLAFLIGAYLIIEYFIYGNKVPGWTSIMTIISFYSGFIIIMLGIIGEYIIRILREKSPRYQYQVCEIIK